MLSNKQMGVRMRKGRRDFPITSSSTSKLLMPAKLAMEKGSERTWKLRQSKLFALQELGSRDKPCPQTKHHLPNRN